MGLSEFYGASSEQEAIATIHRAIDLGITLSSIADWRRSVAAGFPAEPPIRPIEHAIPLLS